MDLHVLGWNAHWRDLFEPNVSLSLLPGRVVVEHRGAYRVETEHGERVAVLAGRLRHVAGRRSDLPAVGDFVAVRLNDAGPTVIETVLPRRTALTRRAAGERAEDQVIAANIDTIFVMAGLDHDFNIRRIERYLAAVWESGASPVVLLNKADLYKDVGKQIGDLRAVAIGVDVHVVSALTAAGVDALAGYWREGLTVGFVGSSGVGKSTLLNCLLGRDAQTTAAVRGGDSRGRHTTTHRELFVLPGGGLVIDTPGLRELQLWDVGASALETTFADVEELAAGCRFGDCTHVHEPGCAVLGAVESGELPSERLHSWRKLQRELRAIAMRHDIRLRKEEARKWRLRAREGRARARQR